MTRRVWLTENLHPHRPESHRLLVAVVIRR
jgi:hypothetical protein